MLITLVRLSPKCPTLTVQTLVSYLSAYIKKALFRKHNIDFTDGHVVSHVMLEIKFLVPTFSDEIRKKYVMMSVILKFNYGQGYILRAC